MTREKELKAQISKLQAELDALPREWPQEGDRYFPLNSYGGARRTAWVWAGDERAMLERGLIFRTLEEAKNADKKRIAIAEWNRLAGDQSWVNWENCQQQKIYPQYFHEDRQCVVYAAVTRQSWPFAHHKTEQDCEAAIRAMGEKMDWLLL